MAGMTVNPRAALRDALADYAGVDRSGPLQARADAVVTAAGNLLDWMVAADVDPGDPPSCGCGGRHWSCPGGGPADGGDMVEPHACDYCGEIYDEAGGDGYAGMCPECADQGVR